MKKQAVLAGVSSAVALISVIALTVCWFAFNTKTANMKFTAGFLQTQVTLYKGVDFDFDGNLDKTVASGSTVATDTYIKVDTSADGVSDTGFSLTADPMFPTQTHVWKIEVKNTGDITGIAQMQFEYPTVIPTELLALSVSVTVDTVTTKYYFCDYTQNGIMPIITNAIEIANGKTGEVRIDLHFETLADLVAHKSDIGLTETGYQALQGKTITVPTLVVNLESQKPKYNAK